MPKISGKVLAMGGILYIGTSVSTYLYLKGKKHMKHCPSCSPSSNTFDRIASDYDRNISMDEILMGITLLRRWLIGSKALGEVLEVSAGTGRNLDYYDFNKKVKALTLTDMSREMLLQAQEKTRNGPQDGEEKERRKISFLLANVENLCENNSNTSNSTDDSITRYGPMLRNVQKVPPRSYDTIVDTFGLCSCSDPVQALKEMAKAVKPEGRILLLEHGKANWKFINSILDDNADQHLQKWGCQWNRDIEGLVRQAGLEIESMSRWHFGTTYVITAKVSAELNRETTSVKSN